MPNRKHLNYLSFQQPFSDFLKCFHGQVFLNHCKCVIIVNNDIENCAKNVPDEKSNKEQQQELQEIREIKIKLKPAQSLFLLFVF